MVQSVELVLGEAQEEAVRDVWGALFDAGLPSQGAIRASTNRPHVTIAVASEIGPDIDEELAEALATTEVAVSLGHPIVFGGNRPSATVAFAVEPDDALREVQRTAYRIVRPCPGVPAHLRPEKWTPHVTVARRVAPDVVPRVVMLAERLRDVGPVEVAGVRRWDGEARRERLLHPPR